MISTLMPGRALKQIFFIAVSVCSMAAQAQWKPAGSRIATPFSASVTPATAWREYPRPQLVRPGWLNLNGLWHYAITPRGAARPENWTGQILVPYAIESSLSGVGQALRPDQELWYRQTFRAPAAWKGKKLVLHFGAVDYQCTVFVNGRQAGVHTGSSDPFSFDISPFLGSQSEHEIVVKVWDPTDSDIQPRGKQSLKPQGFWYTAVSGIWQTVWIEPLSQTNVRVFNPVADLDNQKIYFDTQLTGAQGNEVLDIEIYRSSRLLRRVAVRYAPRIEVAMEGAEPWTPGTPVLYDVKVKLKRGQQVLDSFASYFAMRKISLGKDRFGQERILLNNRPLFQWGVLDQGWWPESLLTPPSDAALRYDMQVLKNLGFNLIRKHIKVEPARFYYHADKMGLLVWQDMPSGFLSLHHPDQHVRFDAEKDWERPKASAVNFEAEWKSIIDQLRFFPSIIVWVPFNEGWGQYDTRRVSEWTMKYDPTRLVSATSGWTDRHTGHMFDAHQYPGPSMEPGSQNPGRALVLGEFGGLGWPVSGHVWDADKRNWGYRNFNDQQSFMQNYAAVVKNVYPLISRGLSAAIYTQTSDVEGEVNGLLTYDRKLLKVDSVQAKKLHAAMYITYPEPVWLVRDAEEKAARHLVRRTPPPAGWETAGTGAAGFTNQPAPVQVASGASLWSVAKFTSEPGTQLAMKIYAQGTVRIYLNGTLVFDKVLLTKRHYDELNLAEHSKLLRSGDNQLAIELTGATADAAFDYGLYRFAGSQN